MKSKQFSILFLFLCFTVFGQQKINVTEIYNGTFRAKGMDELQSLKNSNQYTVLNLDRANRTMQIDLYDFASLKKTATLIDTKDHADLPMIDSYTFDTSEKMILLACNTNQIFRHSFTADYYLYNTTNKVLTKLFDFQIQEPTFSPDGKMIAYAKDNNLYVYELATKKITQITTDGKKNAIINGITDWVYEEEFAFVRAFGVKTVKNWLIFVLMKAKFLNSLCPSLEKIYILLLRRLNIQKQEKKTQWCLYMYTMLL